MTYLVERQRTNGYRCPCCIHLSPETPVETDAEPEARRLFTEFLDDTGEVEDDILSDYYGELVSIRISEPETGVEVARAEKFWGETRKDRYSLTGFVGHWRGNWFREQVS